MVASHLSANTNLSSNRSLLDSSHRRLTATGMPRDRVLERGLGFDAQQLPTRSCHI